MAIHVLHGRVHLYDKHAYPNFSLGCLSFLQLTLTMDSIQGYSGILYSRESKATLLMILLTFHLARVGLRSELSTSTLLILESPV